MQSPTKKRPQSGGGSPDKHAIEIPKNDFGRHEDSSADMLSSLYNRSNKGGRSGTRLSTRRSRKPKFLCDDAEKFHKAKETAEKADKESSAALF